MIDDRPTKDEHMEFRGEDFVVDGSMRDVCILDADLQTWQRLFDGLQHAPGQVSFTTTFEKEPPGVTTNAAALFEELQFDPSASTTLAIQVDHIWFTCYFFDQDEIEFTFHTEDVHDDQTFESLERFVRWLADTCGKRAAVTVESTDHRSIPALLEYSPAHD